MSLDPANPSLVLFVQAVFPLAFLMAACASLCIAIAGRRERGRWLTRAVLLGGLLPLWAAALASCLLAVLAFAVMLRLP